MNNKTLSYSISVEYIGFRDQDVEDIILENIGIELWKLYGVSAIYTGRSGMTPDSFVDRINNGTETTEPGYWVGIPPTQELYFELDCPISKEAMSEFVNHLYEHWGQCINPIFSIRYVSGTVDWNDDDSYESIDGADYMVYVKDVIPNTEE